MRKIWVKHEDRTYQVLEWRVGGGSRVEALVLRFIFSCSYHILLQQTNIGARLDQAETVAVIARGQVTTMMTKMPIMRYLWWQHICQWWDVYETVPALHVVPGSTFSAWRQCKILSWNWCQCKKTTNVSYMLMTTAMLKSRGKRSKISTGFVLGNNGQLATLGAFIQRRILQKTIRRSLFRGELSKMYIQRRKWHILCWEIIQMHLQTTSKVQGPFRGI